MRWKRTTPTTWRADIDGAILYVTRREPRPGVLFQTEVYWPTVNIGGNWIPLVREETLAAAKAACEREVQGVLA